MARKYKRRNLTNRHRRGSNEMQYALEKLDKSVMPPEPPRSQNNPHAVRSNYDYMKAIKRYIDRSDLDKRKKGALKAGLKRIADNILRFDTDPVNVRKMLARILGICLLYKDPAKEVRKFSDSYAVLGHIAQKLKNGEHLDLPNENRNEMKRFKLKMSLFEDIFKLGELYFDVMNSCDGREYASIRIKHITMAELHKLEGKN